MPTEFTIQSSALRDLLPRRPTTKMIVDELLAGSSRKQAAKILGISTHTVDWHIKRLYRDLQIGSLAQLLCLALASPPGIGGWLILAVFPKLVRQAVVPTFFRRIMMRHHVIRVLALAVSFAASAPAHAEPEPGVCYTACTGGMGSECPDEGEMRQACAEAGCPGALPGCAEDFGNCNPGYRIVCNSLQQ